MTWRVEPGSFALVGFEGAPSEVDLAGVEPPWQLTRERDETTLLVGSRVLDPLLARHPGARVERDLVWIRFEAPMAWDVVGFLALVCGRLAHAGVPVGAACGFSRDNLFVGRRHLATARGVLDELFPRSAAQGGPEGD